jgi:Na+/melibiose symporter-like transporter
MAALFLYNLLRADADRASFIFSVASIIDAISNPLMGYLTDNFGKTRLGKRFGRRRFFFDRHSADDVLPAAVGRRPGFWYYLCTYVVFEIIYTSIMVPYETLATEMTDDFSLRSKLTGYKAIFGKLANFLAAFIPGQFILLYGKDSATPFFLTGLTYGVILIVAISCLWYCSWERPREEEISKGEKRDCSIHCSCWRKICVQRFICAYSANIWVCISAASAPNGCLPRSSPTLLYSCCSTIRRWWPG